jgi:diketogulonate reductase-like aldo/keto reductase
LLATASALGVHLTAYSPLGSPDSAKLFKHDGAQLLAHPQVVATAARLGRTPAQVLLRWALQRGTSVIPKSVSPARLRENLDVLSWALDASDVAALSALRPQRRLIDGASFLKPDGPYATLAQLWDEEADGSVGA